MKKFKNKGLLILSIVLLVFIAGTITYRLLQDEEYRTIKKEAIIRPFDLLRAIYIYSVME